MWSNCRELTIHTQISTSETGKSETDGGLYLLQNPGCDIILEIYKILPLGETEKVNIGSSHIISN